MSKYSKEQLKEWAIEFMENPCSARAKRVIIALGLRRCMTSGEVVARIGRIARG